MKIINLNNDEFDSFIQFLKQHGVEYPENNQFAFTIILENESVIIYNSDSEIDDNLKQIVIQHELAHTNGIMNEEDADKWALQHLNKYQRKMLINEWPKRHGHNYCR